MRVGVIGINYKTSSLDLREILARACRYSFSSNRFSFYTPGTVLLSTCNRTEVYFSAEDLSEAHGMILAELRQYVHVPFEQKLYSFFGTDCFCHLAKVAAGLDSAIVSETEIQCQVRQAYQVARHESSLSCCLHFLFQKSLKISKEVRSAFPLPRGLPTLEKVLFQIVQKEKKTLAPKILFIGNSQINRQIISFFRAKQVGAFTLCTRYPEKAESLLQEGGIELANWSVLPRWMAWDIIICATQHQNYLLQLDHVNHGKDTHKPSLIFDLSVPRNVDPRLPQHHLLHLFNIEQLAQIIDMERRQHLGEIDEAHRFVEQAVERQAEIYHQKLLRHLTCAS